MRNAALVALTVGPIFLGMFGAGAWFIPNHSFRWAAASMGIAYYALFFGYFKLRRVADKSTSGSTTAQQKKLGAILGCLVATYFGYVAFYIMLPVGFTVIFGEPTQRSYIVEEIEKVGARATLCPFRVKLEGVSTVLDDSFCINEITVRLFSVGQSVELVGTETKFGFRFTDIRANSRFRGP
ncbi:MAG: hypothetical protein JSS86_00035 [Cyanobacteria bacterium SZAS LIN-2]|nr:hypothetical protein [Cyanobacteria bacterium SZAS LIN-2]